jgi:signal transduction histidine kinase
VPITLRTPGGWLNGSAWLFVLLALLTVLPAAFVLWFTSDALTREAAGAQQRVLEAYRGQLRLVRARLDPIWRAHAAQLDESVVSGFPGPPKPQGEGGSRTAAGGVVSGFSRTVTPAQRFQQLITDEIADGVVLLTPDGSVAYPDRGKAHNVAELAQRLSAAAALTPEARPAVVTRLAAALNDYSTPITADGRLMLMDRLRALAPNVSLPTQAALRLSIEMLDAERAAPVPDVIRQTAAPNVWALTSADGRVIAFYRTGRLEAMMHDVLHQVAPSGITFIAFPPDVPADTEAIAAGPWLPGWQLSFMPIDTAPFDAGTSRRRTLYLSVALAGIGLMTITGLAVAGTLRRHLNLARMKTDLVATASHELRTPLASMRVLVDGLLADEVFDAKKTREYLELVAAENARLSRLIDNFLTFSRLERGRYQFAFAPADPSAIVTAAVDAVRDRVPPDCDLRVEISPAVPVLTADAEALTTALINLLDNALKYTSAEKRIAVRARPDGNTLVLFEVADNGIGIPVREQARIFRRFYRVEQLLSRKTGGVGLGLSIVELIVRGHGGTVSVRSEPGAGSTFTLRLPCAARGTIA